jgi:hypothetical protein
VHKKQKGNKNISADSYKDCEERAWRGGRKGMREVAGMSGVVLKVVMRATSVLILEYRV